MQDLSNQLVAAILPIAIIIWITAIILWLFPGHGLDKIKHPEEWRTIGSSGERIVYHALIGKLKIPERQILRNVYIPRDNGKTSEIDLLVVSKKGIFVFECKNYGGNIYGDAKRRKWLQYIGKEKHYFYNPLLQNKNHVKYLHDFLIQSNIEVPIIPCLTAITRGNWKIRNLTPDDHFLGYNCHLQDIYNNLPDAKAMAKHFKTILSLLTPLSRPDSTIREKHISQIHHR